MARYSGALIWDFPTRVFHWALVCAVITSFVSVNQNMMSLHFQAGGTVLFLILFRVLWGILGPDTARFLQFLPTPARLRDWRAGGIGHSPWGALSVFAILGVVGAQASLGLFTDDEIYLTGPLRDYVTGRSAFAATSYHAALSKVILGLVALHVAAIAVYAIVLRSDLFRVFITGRRKAGTRSITPRPWYVAVICAVLAALPVIWIFEFA